MNRCWHKGFCALFIFYAGGACAAVAPDVPHDATYVQALNSLRVGRVSEAHELLRRRLQSMPSDLSALRVLVSLLLDAGQFSEAKELLIAGVSLSPQSLDLVMGLARLQADQGEYVKALKTLEGSAHYARKRGDYLAFLAVLSAQTGSVSAAVSLWQDALQMEPQQAHWWLALGALQLGQKDYANARVSYAKALALNLDSLRERQAKAALRQMPESLL